MAQAPETLLVVYDFDQTISSDHIYHHLDSTASTRTGQGQLAELNKLALEEVYELFGGKDRVDRLNIHFSRVTTVAAVSILSFGYVEVIKKSLEQMNLYKYFENATIIGCDSDELKQVHGSKAQCIEEMSKKRNIKSDQILFVDDDAGNIRKAENSKVCKTIEINPRNGMSNEHMEKIEKLIGVFEIETKVNDKNDKIGNDATAATSTDATGTIGTDSTNANNNNDNNNNDNNGTDNNNNNDSIIDDSKEPNTNRQQSWKDKFGISDKNNDLLNKLIDDNNNESEGSPVVEIAHESDSETNLVLMAPVIPNGNSNSVKEPNLTTP